MKRRKSIASYLQRLKPPVGSVRTSLFQIDLSQPLMGFVLLLGIGVLQFAFAQNTPSPWPNGCKEGTLGTPGQPDYQMTLVCLPQETSWNGNLFVYAHGFVNPKDPLALPTEELGTINVGDKNLLHYVLSLGYAFATTSYSKNGWAIEQASTNLNALVDHVRASTPSPLENVLIVGASEGGLVTVMQLEKYPQIYSGGLSLCGAVDGSPLQIQYIGDFRSVFDYYFPNVFNFGTVTIPNHADLQWQSQYSPAISNSLQANPNATQSLFQVIHAAEDSSDLANSRNTTSQVTLGYNIFETNDLIQTAGGNPYGNTDRHYTGSPDDPGLNAGVERISADPSAVNYIHQFYQATGDLQHPLVTLHNLQDPNVPYQHEIAYGSKVESKNQLSNLTSIPVPGYGHCDFQASEVLGALSILVARTQSLPSLPEVFSNHH